VIGQEHRGRNVSGAVLVEPLPRRIQIPPHVDDADVGVRAMGVEPLGGDERLHFFIELAAFTIGDSTFL
jgi:hypothetical protein